MILPKVTIEKELLTHNKIIIGIDEVGRGPLAGPVVAGAVWVRPEALDENFEDRGLIRDSKLLSEKQREKIFEIINENDAFVYGIGEVSESIIDKVNILNATFLAMRFAIDQLLDKMKERGIEIDEDKICALLDGNRKIPKVNFEQHLFPRGDKHIFSIAAASICAKVYRDRLMDEYHKKFPQYGFKQHKGYGTALHMECLKQHGPCKIHRTCFAPVRQLLVKEEVV